MTEVKSKRRFWIVTVVMGLIGLSALCLRYDFLASPSDPPSPDWRNGGKLSQDALPLQNVPVVLSSASRGGELTVTIANEGTTTLEYLSEFRGILPNREIEDLGKWIAVESGGICGVAISVEQIAPGQRVEIPVDFSSVRRERLLGQFTEKGTNRTGLVVFATENGRITPHPGRTILLLSTGIAAVCVWLIVRIINRRERWGMFATAVLLLLAYPLSFWPACSSVGHGVLSPEVASTVYCPLVQLLELDSGRPARLVENVMDDDWTAIVGLEVMRMY